MRLPVRRGIAGAVRTMVSTITLVSAIGVAVWAQDLRIVDAVERQDREATRLLLAQRAEVNAAQADGATALHWAVHWNDFETATLLIGAGADPNALNELGVAPLALASLNASPEMAAALLRAGADPNVARPSGETALMTGARTGSVELVRTLLDSGAEVNADAHYRGSDGADVGGRGRPLRRGAHPPRGRRERPCPLEVWDHVVASGGSTRRSRDRSDPAGVWS